MFSFLKRNKPQEHPVLGSIIYRANKGNNKADIPGFWEGVLEVDDYGTVQLLIWGDRTGPTAEQVALFRAIKDELAQYVQASKDGLYNYIKVEETKNDAESRAALPCDLDHPAVAWDLEQLYIQAYPMRARLKEDLPENLHQGVAWGFCFSVGGFWEGDGSLAAYSAYIDKHLHPTFPFTYH